MLHFLASLNSSLQKLTRLLACVNNSFVAIVGRNILLMISILLGKCWDKFYRTMRVVSLQSSERQFAVSFYEPSHIDFDKKHHKQIRRSLWQK